jgi:hypothetical protein
LGDWVDPIHGDVAVNIDHQPIAGYVLKPTLSAKHPTLPATIDFPQQLDSCVPAIATSDHNWELEGETVCRLERVAEDRWIPMKGPEARMYLEDPAVYRLDISVCEDLAPFLHNGCSWLDEKEEGWVPMQLHFVCPENESVWRIVPPGDPDGGRLPKWDEILVENPNYTSSESKSQRFLVRGRDIDKCIWEFLVSNYGDPPRLPPFRNGTASPAKQAAIAALVDRRMSRKSFDDSWSRLTAGKAADPRWKIPPPGLLA